MSIFLLNGSISYKENDLDPLSLIMLEEKIGLKPGTLTKWNLLDWKYFGENESIIHKNTLILFFKSPFSWPADPSQFPYGVKFSGIEEMGGITGVPVENIYM